MIDKRLKELRSALRLTQAEFGKRLGVSRDVINNLECGRVVPKEVFLDHVCLIYNVNPVWLNNGEGDIFADPAQADKDFTDALDIWNALTPKLRKYALGQMKALLEVQNSGDE